MYNDQRNKLCFYQPLPSPETPKQLKFIELRRHIIEIDCSQSTKLCFGHVCASNSCHIYCCCGSVRKLIAQEPIYAYSYLVPVRGIKIRTPNINTRTYEANPVFRCTELWKSSVTILFCVGRSDHRLPTWRRVKTSRQSPRAIDYGKLMCSVLTKNHTGASR